MTRRPRPLADVLPALRDRLAPMTLLADVQARWAVVAGDEISRVSEPVSERAGVVTVSCASAVWASELSMMSPRLVEMLNEGRSPGSPAVAAMRFEAKG